MRYGETWRVKGITWWRVGVILGEAHLCFEVSSIVERIGVHDNECDIPLKDVLMVKLLELLTEGNAKASARENDLHIHPFLF